MLKSKDSLEDELDRFLNAKLPSPEEPLPPNKNKSKKWRWFFIGSVILFVAVIGVGGLFRYELKKLERRHRQLSKVVAKMQQGISYSASTLGNRPMPFRLVNVPFAEDSGIVVRVKPVTILNVYAPYNPGLVETPTGYDLFFRYDVLSARALHHPYYAYIGVAPLNKDFEQQAGEFKRIKLPTDYAEDPRAMIFNDQLLLFYNALNTDNLNCRSMGVSSLDRKTFAVQSSAILDMNLRWVEKNWVPFEYVGPDNDYHLLAEYQLSPRKLIEIADLKSGEIKNVTLPRDVAYFEAFWAKNWGEMRGGAPARKIGDEYLGFFHSSFEVAGCYWFVMGAYTFEAVPPFRMTAISNHPILFRGIYELPYANTAPHDKCVIYPCGFVMEKQDDRELIHLACGENDSGVKIVTFDKDKLLKNLRRFENK